MYVRKKKNPSGVVSVQIIKKYRDKHQYVRTVGSSSDAQEIEDLYFQGKKWIMEQKCERDMFFAQARQADEKAVTDWILSQEKSDGKFYEYQKNEHCKLILGYCEQRAKKDAFNREKGIKRLEKEYKTGKITKDKINKRGYNKFLEVSDDVNVKIDYSKIEEDKK
jgi:hypothetical protein